MEKTINSSEILQTIGFVLDLIFLFFFTFLILTIIINTGISKNVQIVFFSAAVVFKLTSIIINLFSKRGQKN